MSLFHLVKLRNELTLAMDASQAIAGVMSLHNQINDVKAKVEGVISVQNARYIDKQLEHYKNLIPLLQRPIDEFPAQLKRLNDEILQVTRSMFANNYELEERLGSVEQIRATRKLPITDQIRDDVLRRISLYTNWKYPTLEIGCKDGEWTEHLVAADPLYVMDQHQEFLDSTNSLFPEVYQGRLRKYLLKDNSLHAIPKNQFAFVFSWNFFNYVSIDTMNQFLKQVFEVLRPGGTFMFSYNDGDTPAGAGMAENFSQSYMPKSILIPLCLSYGFTVESEFAYEPNTSWLEIRKPGVLKTIKAHQVLGEIVHKDLP